MKKSFDAIKKTVKERYARAATGNVSCCSSDSCCSGVSQANDISKKIGYRDSEIKSVPEGANLGFGCGNPVALAALKKGDVVLDLGSGAGFDAFLAAGRVGPTGRVIGVDMTPEMVAKANGNVKKGKYTNVEFRLGEIEKLPVEDGSIDVVISNCVINLSPDKETVFKEAHRVLKAGGRLMVSDLVLTRDLPQTIKDSVEAYVGWFSGAIKKREYLGHMSTAGFEDIQIINESAYPVDVMIDNFRDAYDAVVSIKVSAVKR